MFLAEDLSVAIVGELAAGEPVNAPAEAFVSLKGLIERAIEQTNGSYTHAAKPLGVHANQSGNECYKRQKLHDSEPVANSHPWIGSPALPDDEIL